LRNNGNIFLLVFEKLKLITMLKIGITGGIGVGKSVVCKIFAAIGIDIYDADSRAKWLMNNDAVLVQEIKNTFGEIAYADGQINRTFMIEQILGSPITAKKLEHLVHPAVGRDFTNFVNQIAQEKPQTKYVLKEAALLYEANSYKDLDKIIVVSANLDTRIARVLARDAHRNREQIEAIIAKQMPDSEKIAKADFVIYNDNDNLLIPQVLKIHHEISGYSPLGE
jgi:dephospho-CoA kinase